MAYVEFEKCAHIGIIRLNRPEALNALSFETLRQLDQTLDAADADAEIYVLIITGVGRSFAAGADISEMEHLTAVQAKAFSRFGNSVFLKLENLRKPVIAAVNGFCLGGGNELAMACDIRISCDKARFGQPEVGLGITPGFGGTQRMARLIGLSRTMELLLTAKMIDAQEAKEIGLVNAVYPAEDLMPAAICLAKAIASNAQIAVRQTKDCVRRGIQTDISTAIAYETEAFGICFATEDQKDAMRAFLEKRNTDGFKNR